MKLMEKLKNALFEEEYVEVEEKPVKEKKKIFHKDKEKDIEQIKNKGRARAKEDFFEEKPLVKKIANPIEKEEKHELLDDFEEDRSLLKGNNDFKFQEILEDDFSYQQRSVQPKPQPQPQPKPEPVYQERKPVVEEKVQDEVPLYQGGKKEEVFGFEKDYNTMHTYDSKSNKSTFKPSPIISPIYGVLDKNYQKDEIVTKKEVRMPTFASEKPDIDEVRNRAYGNAKPEKDLLFDVEEEQSEESYNYAPEPTEDLLDLTDKEQTPSVSQVTVGDAEEYFEDLGLEYNNDYIDLSKEKATGRRTSSMDKYDEEPDDEDDKMIEVEKSDDENLFDLIDSMYEKE